MYVLNTQERTIKRFSNKDLSIWVNELIKYNRSLKSYVFMSSKKEATKFITKQLKANNGWKRLGKAIYGILCSGYCYGTIDNPI
jgi:hypothetical protein